MSSPEKQKILSVFGHPDDAEQFAGGTMKLLADKGHDITIASLSDGACGSKTHSAVEIVAIRRKESEKAASMIGAKFVNLGIPDGSIEYNLENTKKVVALIRDEKPDIIFTHPSTGDYMTDHWHTGSLVLWAVPEAKHKNFKALTDTPPIQHIPYVYHTDPQGLMFADGQIARVNTIVDISDVIEEKLDAFSAHESQMGFMSHRNKPDAARKTRRWAETRGEQVRVAYGEGFTQQLNAEYPRRNILVEMLPEKVYTL